MAYADIAHYLRAVTLPSGERVEYDYNFTGQKTNVRVYSADQTLFKSTEYAYGARGYLDYETTSSTTTYYTFDAMGNLTYLQDPNDNSTSYTVDALDHATEVWDANGGQTLYAFDTNGNLSSVTAPNGANTLINFDDLGQVRKEISPDRGNTDYLYDTAGNLTQLTDASGIAVAYNYDASNRLISVDYPGTSEDVTLVYDNCTHGDGKVCTITDSTGAHQFTYNAFGEVSRYEATIGTTVFVTAYEYNARGLPDTITYPSGAVVTMSRDTQGRVVYSNVKIGAITTDIVNSVTYKSENIIDAYSLGNGIQEVRTYDSYGFLENQDITNIDFRTYSYDGLGNVNDINTIDRYDYFGYDALYQLTYQEGWSFDWSESDYRSLSYDENGNRTLLDANIERPEQSDYIYEDLSYDYATNRLNDISGNVVQLDSVGNTLVNSNGQTYSYSSSGRLAQVYVDSALVATYTYDWMSRRRIKDTGGNQIVYHYNNNGQLMSELTINGAPIRDYIWMDQRPVAIIDHASNPVSITYLSTDHLGTPRYGTNSVGQLVWRWKSGPFGDGLPNEDVDGDSNLVMVNLRFSGQYFDQETGMHYNFFRYYDPATGRYVTSDPIGLNGGLNTFRYVNANPLKYVDPLGLRDIVVDPIFEKDFEEVLYTPTGRQLVEDIMAEDNNFPLEIFPVPTCDVSYNPDIGIGVNPKYNPTVDTSNGKQVPSRAEQLAHELGHVVAPQDSGIKRSDPNFRNKRDKWEMDHIVKPWENPIRKQLGKPSRRAYDPVQPANCDC